MTPPREAVNAPADDEHLARQLAILVELTVARLALSSWRRRVGQLESRVSELERAFEAASADPCAGEA